MIELGPVMTAIGETAAQAGIIERVWDYPTDTVSPPCLVVGYPEAPQQFDLTMARGADRATFPAWLVVGRFVERAARDQITPYVEAFKAAIEDPDTGLVFVSGDLVRSVRVTSWAVEPFAVESLDYLSVKFEIDVIT